MDRDAFYTFGELLAYLRKRKRLTQEELARAVGYSREQIVRLEKNRRVPDLAVIAAVFIPALQLRDEPQWIERLLNLAAAARGRRQAITITRTVKHQLVATETITTSALPPAHLPAPLLALLGREREIDQLVAQLIDPYHRLITLLGPPGVGKTRLALQAAWHVHPHFADGAYWIDLSAIDSAARVPSALRQALELPEALGDERAQLRDWVRSRHTLLILDNFEQIIDAGSFVAELLEAAPRLQVLITSRTPLHIYGEHEYQVPPLPVPDLAALPPPDLLAHVPSVALLIERAHAVKPNFAITTANALALAAIVVRLDGLPLAIELAAAQLKTLSPEELAAKLVNQLDTLTRGPRNRSTRQQTLRGAIAWSFDRLDDEAQRLFARLGVFSGFTPEAADSIGRSECLIELVDANLVQVINKASDPPRFALLETLREFALEQLASHGEETIVRHRHAQYFLELAVEAEAHWSSAEQPAWLAQLDRDRDNLRTALKWWCETNAQSALQLAAALGPFWSAHGYYREGRMWLTRVLAFDVADENLRARGLLMAALLAQQQTDLDEAMRLAEESLALYRRLNDLSGAGRALRACGWTAVDQGRLLQAQRLFEESLCLARAIDDVVNIADVLGALAYVMGFIAPDTEQARAYLLEGVMLNRRLGRLEGVAFALMQQGVLESLCGEYARAEQVCLEALDIYRRLGIKQQIIWTLDVLGESHLCRAQLEAARACFDEALHISQETGVQQGVTVGLYHLGQIEQHAGHPGTANAYFQRSLSLACETNDTPMIGRGLAGLGGVMLANAQADRAVQLLSAAFRHFDQLPPFLTPADRAEYEEWIGSARSVLGEADFATAWQTGQAMSQQHALELALQASK